MPVVSPKTKLDAIPGPTTRTTSKGRPVWVSITFWEGFAALRVVAETEEATFCRFTEILRAIRDWMAETYPQQYPQFDMLL